MMRMLSKTCAPTLGGLALLLGMASGVSAEELPVTSQLSSDGGWTAFLYKGQMLPSEATVRVTQVTCKKQGSGDPFSGYTIGLFRRSGNTPCSGAKIAGEIPPEAEPVLPDAGGLQYKPHFSDLCVSSKGEKFTCQLSGIFKD